MKLIRGVDGEMKLCPGCRELFQGLKTILLTFSPDPKRGDGLRVYCKLCRSNRRKAGLGR